MLRPYGDNGINEERRSDAYEGSHCASIHCGRLIIDGRGDNERRGRTEGTAGCNEKQTVIEKKTNHNLTILCHSICRVH